MIPWTEKIYDVTPFTGVWIEIGVGFVIFALEIFVTPFTGVWIEIEKGGRSKWR